VCATSLPKATHGQALSLCKMGLAYNVYLNAKRIYGCKNCKTHLADHDEIISRVSHTNTDALRTYCSNKLIFLGGRTSVASMAKPSSSTAW